MVTTGTTLLLFFIEQQGSELGRSLNMEVCNECTFNLTKIREVEREREREREREEREREGERER